MMTVMTIQAAGGHNASGRRGGGRRHGA